MHFVISSPGTVILSPIFNPVKERIIFLSKKFVPVISNPAILYFLGSLNVGSAFAIRIESAMRAASSSIAAAAESIVTEAESATLFVTAITESTTTGSYK